MHLTARAARPSVACQSALVDTCMGFGARLSEIAAVNANVHAGPDDIAKDHVVCLLIDAATRPWLKSTKVKVVGEKAVSVHTIGSLCAVAQATSDSMTMPIGEHEESSRMLSGVASTVE